MLGSGFPCGPFDFFMTECRKNTLKLLNIKRYFQKQHLNQIIIFGFFYFYSNIVSLQISSTCKSINQRDYLLCSDKQNACLILYQREVMSGAKQEIRVKLLIIGQSYVGKSSLLTQYVDEEFSLNHIATIGVQYKQKTIKLEDGVSIRVQIWDTAGTIRYNTITPNYYRNVDGILLVFDISNKKSFEMINFWIKEVNEKTDVSKIDLLLVGNKIDLQESREVSKETAEKVSKEVGIVYIQTSAKTFQTTKVAFDQLVAKILKRKKKFQSTAQGFTLQQRAVNKKKQDNCC